MSGPNFFQIFTTLTLLVTIATANNDTYQCRILYEYDASVKGTVSSPFYGERDYHNGLWCEYRIRAPEGHRIRITFKDFDIKPTSACRQDHLVVYGKDKKSVLGMLCGSELPKPFISNEGENEIRLLLRTDVTDAGRGFLLEYESGPTMHICNSGYVQCANRNCYKPEQKCDGVDNCGDGTDEENCNHKVAIVPEECGVQRFKPKTLSAPDRMVGGEEAVPNSWPWQVSLQLKFSEPNGHFCGGTLINSQWVLTAVNCVIGAPIPGIVKIVMGSHGKFTKTAYEHVRYNAKVFMYPNLKENDFEGFDSKHDISLIKLNAPVTFNDGVQPACLVQRGENAQPGSSCIATGWGETKGSGFDDVLKQAELVVQASENCNSDEQSQICLQKNQNYPCNGDSGGPLQCKNKDGKWYVYGSASSATINDLTTGQCLGDKSYTIYENVADKADWIQKIISENS